MSRIGLHLSILIVNWNSTDFVRKCLLSIDSTCAELAPEIIVVDGGSFDGCREMLASEFPKVRFVQSPDNIGFGRSNNLGFEQVTGDTLLLLNPDTEVKPGAVQTMLEHFRKLPRVGILGPKLLNSDGTLQITCVRAWPTPFNRALDSDFSRRLFPASKLWGTWEAFRSDRPIRVEAVSGACMMLSTEVFRRVGGFTPDYFMYGEDMDLCWKIHRCGLDVIYIPNAEIVHHGGGSSRVQVSHFSTIKMREAWDTYMRLNHGVTAAMMCRGLQGLSAVVRLGVSLLLIPFLKGSRKSAAVSSLRKWWYVLKWVVSSPSTGSRL